MILLITFSLLWIYGLNRFSSLIPILLREKVAFNKFKSRVSFSSALFSKILTKLTILFSANIFTYSFRNKYSYSLIIRIKSLNLLFSTTESVSASTISLRCVVIQYLKISAFKLLDRLNSEASNRCVIFSGDSTSLNISISFPSINPFM